MSNELQSREQMQVQQKSPTREAGTREGTYFEPPVDIYETNDALVVVADIPGVEATDIQTDVRENLLTITATVRPSESQQKRIAYQEYSVGHFLRQFRLGQQIDQGKISAQLKDGVLTLTLPKSDYAKPRQITVQTG